MSLFLYGIEIWEVAYQGKYFDHIDRFFLSERLDLVYTNNLYVIADIRNRDCRLWNTRDLQIRLRQRLRVQVFHCVPDAHARLREAVMSTRSVFKISSPF